MINKARISILTIFLLFLVARVVQHVTAQSTTATVSTPMDGFLLLTGNLEGSVQGQDNTQLLRVDTSTGDVQILVDETLSISSPVLNYAGDQVAFYQPQAGVQIYDLATSSKSILIAPEEAVTHPQAWSASDSDLLNIDFRYDSNTQNFFYELQQFNIPTNSTTSILNIMQGESIVGFPLPTGIPSVNLNTLEQVAWNPIYPNWVLLQFSGTNPNILTPEGFEVGIILTVLYNLQTGQSLSVDNLFTNTIALESLAWRSDGVQFAVETRDGIKSETHIVGVNGLDATPSLQLLSSADDNDQVFLNWLGSDNLLLTSTRDSQTNDVVYFLSQIIGGTWFTQEFVRLADSDFDRFGESIWSGIVDLQDQYEISCLFDQAMAARIGVGQRARVNFTDGTPLRLRTEPDFGATEIVQMPEGTEFDIIGGSACVNDGNYYRFWQLELDDGTIGWAAEANTTDYFMEPIQ